MEPVRLRRRHGNAPAQLAVLGVALAELERHLRPRQLDPEIEGVAAVGLHAQRGVKVERIGGHMVPVAVVDVQPVVRDLDAVVGIGDGGGVFRDLLGTVGERAPVAQAQEAAPAGNGTAAPAAERRTDPSAATAPQSQGSVDVEALMAEGALPDVVLGDPNAPVTIVEYASLTCPHCATFHNSALPDIKADYVDTGIAKVILREFPFDPAALAGFMLARCVPEERREPRISVLFQQQQSWARAENVSAALLSHAPGGLGVLDVAVRRNAFGAQVDSFEEDLDVPAVAAEPVHAVFIRAPAVVQAGEGVEVLASVPTSRLSVPAADPGLDGDARLPVAVRQGHLLATAFHPEVTGDWSFHRAFLAGL